MTSTTGFGASDTASLDAERYLKDVAPHLAALPADERADLLEDLAQHLREIAAEPGPPLSERLGSPEAYAAELLSSAGVEHVAGTHPPMVARFAGLVESARRSWAGQEVLRTWPFLPPAWWVLRAFLVVSILSAGQGFPLPRLGGNPALGLLGILVAVPLSVRLGQRRLPSSGRLAVLAANAVLAVYALSLLGRVGNPEIRYVGSSAQPVARLNEGCLVTAAGDRITNLYAYDAEGRLLDPVLLYDQNGQPVDNLCPEYDERGRRLSTEYRRDVNGAPVINAFPRRQSAAAAPGRAPLAPARELSPEATVPVRPPAVVVPRLAPTTTTVAPPAG